MAGNQRNLEVVCTSKTRQLQYTVAPGWRIPTGEKNETKSSRASFREMMHHAAAEQQLGKDIRRPLMVMDNTRGPRPLGK